MQKEKMLPLAVFMCAIVLLGAGCSSTDTTKDSSDNAMMQADDSAMMEEDNNMMESDDNAMMDDDNSMMESDDSMEAGENMMEDDSAMMEAADHTFEISGTNFAFSETELRVKKGDTVTIKFTSSEGMHDWVVDEFDARTEIIQAGGASEVTFVADETGEFEYYCSVGQHRANGMVGTLIVE